MQLTNNNNPTIDELIDGGSILTTPQMIDGPYFDVSVRSAIKLMYPLLVHEMQCRGYSNCHIEYRLKNPDNSDIELIDLIESTIRDIEENYEQ